MKQRRSSRRVMRPPCEGQSAGSSPASGSRRISRVEMRVHRRDQIAGSNPVSGLR